VIFALRKFAIIVAFVIQKKMKKWWNFNKFNCKFSFSLKFLGPELLRKFPRVSCNYHKLQWPVAFSLKFLGPELLRKFPRVSCNYHKLQWPVARRK
jgi:hypothetical protein